MDHQDLDKNPPQNELTISCVGQNLKKIVPQLYKRPRDVTKLNLDNNDILKLEQLERMPFIRELTMSHNQLARMYPVHNLKYLKKLDLSFNCILVTEGLRMLFHLEYLNLAGNKIKSMEGLQSNLMLEHIDLSENLFVSFPNVSELNKLKTLHFHKNKLKNLKSAELYLPKSLTILTLAGNQIQDLTEVSHLAHLPNLNEISFVNNPCVVMFNQSPIEFDFRPYIISWCLHLQIIDGYAIDDLERLKAEWLYSQGKGRKFRPGQHAELVDYLMATFPFTSRKLLSESESKLRLVLSKAHQHQRQLQMAEQQAADKSRTNELISRSLDSSLIGIGSSREHSNTSTLKQDSSNLTRSLCDSTYFDPLISDEFRASTSKENTSRSHLTAPTKLVPVPESLVNPRVSNFPPTPAPSEVVISPDQVSNDKLQTIKQVAQIKREKERESLSQNPSNVRRSAWDFTSDEGLCEPSSKKAINVQNPVLNEPQISIREELVSSLETNNVTPASSFLATSEVSTCTQKTVAKFPRQSKIEEKSDVPNSCSLQESVNAPSIFLLPSDLSAFLRVSKSGTSLIGNKITYVQESVIDTLESISTSSNVTSGAFPLQDQMKEQSDWAVQDEKPIPPVKISKEKTGHILMSNSSVKKMNKEVAAVCIQKYWRGYQARKYNGKASSVVYHLHTKRTIQHIKKISQEIEIMRASLDNDHRIQNLQMLATRALWKKVQDLQGCMQELIHCVTPVGSSRSISMSTQTDDTAVHSPTLQANNEAPSS